MIQAAALLALLAVARPTGSGDAAPSSAPLSLTALLALPAPAAGPQGVPAALSPPRGWVSFGINWVSSSVEVPAIGEIEEDEPLSLDLGFYTWKGEMGLGLEFGLIHSTYKVEVTSLDSEEVDVYRGQIGLRVADRGLSEMFTTWARAGLLYRIDDGTLLEDSGFGYYLGAGLDWRVFGPLALSPSFTFADSTSYSSEEWLLGLALTVLF